jgi:putative phosphotransacetylase
MKHIQVICEVSNKHCHLTEETLKKAGLSITKKNDISQPGQWVTNELYEHEGEKYRIVMPCRESDQFELSLTDWIRKFGRDRAPVWKKGNEPGFVVTQRHLHASTVQAEELGLKHGDMVSLKKTGIRGGQFDNVLVRVSDTSDLRIHLDTDEANAFYIKNGERMEVIY